MADEPKYRSYEERKVAQEKLRRENNRKTHQEYKLPPVPPPGGGKQQKRSPPPSRAAFDELPPTRDMEPVKLPLKRKVQGEFADVIPLHTDKQKRD